MERSVSQILQSSHNQNGAKHQLSNLVISFFKSPLTSKISNKNLHSDSQFLKFEEVSDFIVYFTINLRLSVITFPVLFFGGKD